MPIEGTVTAFNTALEDTPEVVNTDPYGEGWIIKVAITPESDHSHLLDATAYKALIEG